MNKRTLYNYMLLIFWGFPGLLNSTVNPITIRSKSENGNDRCEKLSCLESPAAYSSDDTDNTVEVELTINLETPSYPFAFPWRIKAYSNSGIYLGETDQIYEDDFSILDGYPLLRRIKTTLYVLPGAVPRIFMTENSEEPECLINQCGEEYNLANISFGVYSGSRAIDETCESFNSPYLSNGELTTSKEFRACDCLINMGPRPSTAERVNINTFQQSKSHIRSIYPWKNPISKEGSNSLHSQAQSLETTVFPNPVSSTLTVQSPLLAKVGTIVQLHNTFGKVITIKNGIGNENRLSIELGHFPNGLYLLQLKNGAKVTTTRIMITH